MMFCAHRIATRISFVSRRGWSRRSRCCPQAQQQQQHNFIESKAYRIYLQGAVGVAVLGLVDAGYSGDWSRIGVLTKPQEEQLQQLVQILAVIHVACAIATAALQRPGVLALKALLTGPLALAEALYTSKDV